MVLDTLFTSKHRPVAIVSLVVLGVGLIGTFITTIVWWTRINPWFGKGRGIYRIVYNNVSASWILSLVALIALAVYVALDLFAKDLFDKITGSLGGTVTAISIVGVFAVSSLITGAYASSYALDRYHFKNSDFKLVDFMGDMENFYENLENYYKEKLGQHLCEGYFYDGIMKVSEKIEEKDYEKWEKWGDKMGKKALVEKKLFTIPSPPLEQPLEVKLDFLNGYMCETIGVPTLIFTMIIGVGIIMFFYLIVISAFRDASDKSEAEA